MRFALSCAVALLVTCSLSFAKANPPNRKPSSAAKKVHLTGKFQTIKLENTKCVGTLEESEYTYMFTVEDSSNCSEVSILSPISHSSFNPHTFVLQFMKSDLPFQFAVESGDSSPKAALDFIEFVK